MLVSSPIELAPGTISRASSICFAGSPATYGSIPVTLPPGRASLTTKPKWTASASAGQTIGIDEVACLAAAAATTALAKTLI